MSTRAAVYVRVSTEDQAREGYGLEVQRQRCIAMAQAKGWGIPVCEYADEGISGTVDESERPGLARLLEDVEDGNIDAVVILALDRLGRKTSLVLDLVDRLASAGAELVSCKESLDTSTPQGQFVLTMFAAMAQLERDVIVERTTAGRNARGKVDGERGGRVPFGYVRTFDAVTGAADGVTVDEDAAVVVKRIFRERKDGEALSAIAEELNADRISTARGHQWHASSVRTVLQNAGSYTGGARGASDVRWPKLISHQLARAALSVDARAGRIIRKAA